MVDVNIKDYRIADHPIDELFLKRWSPRSFSDKQIEESDLMSLFEAARWAPSGSNKQPWRYIIARSEVDKEKFYSFIKDTNLAWCKKAPVLALIVSDAEANGSHAFDAGTSWGYLALQAMQKGLVTHAMGGFYKDKAREALNIPEQFQPHAVIAIGYQDAKEKLAEKLQQREAPSPRRPLAETVFEGEYRG
ncbi:MULTISPECIES: nitroreductase family protein [Gracilibacillus]|uniref:nitroreductase family protein n=1 Tax=Gracilibacillus TaxID=74385 RepID=UPI000824FE9A|nr:MULTISPECIES: nitroreductase family protein [Gracilibacillus]